MKNCWKESCLWGKIYNSLVSWRNFYCFTVAPPAQSSFEILNPPPGGTRVPIPQRQSHSLTDSHIVQSFWHPEIYIFIKKKPSRAKKEITTRHLYGTNKTHGRYMTVSECWKSATRKKNDSFRDSVNIISQNMAAKKNWKKIKYVTHFTKHFF